MRRYVSLFFSLAVFSIGIWLFYYLYFHALKIHGMVVVGGGMLVIFGLLSAIDDIKQLLKTENK